MSTQTRKRRAPRAVGRGAPGRERVPRVERERQMIGVATEIFAARGYEASMDEIAEAAGITKPMLYSYFGSKDGLFAACTRQAAAALREDLAEVVRQPATPPDQLFYQGVLALFNFVERNRESWKVLHPEGAPAAGTIGEEATEAREAMVGLLEQLFRQVAAGQGVAEEALSHMGTMSRAFTAATLAVASDWARNPEEPKELVALRLMNFAWIGFGDLLEGRLWLPGQGDSA
jgi:AcrR family transcriptional regulator